MTDHPAVAFDPAVGEPDTAFADDTAGVFGGTRPRTGADRRAAWTFRVTVVLAVVVFVAVIRTVRTLAWKSGRVPVGPFQTLLSYGGYLWALPALPAALALLGFVLSPGLAPTKRDDGGVVDDHPVPCPHEVCFRVVSRGQNVGALRSTVAAVRRHMAALPLFPYRIEVVTDTEVDLDDHGIGLTQLVVPAGYATPLESRYKARALQYALEQSTLPDHAWLMHLDEESRLSPSLVVGIRDAVVEEERRDAPRIGQGCILYHQKFDEHPFLTLADMLRTGDDLGRFFLQHRLGFTLFGLHGSFILVRNDVEKRVGFDFGPEGSITEDAFWALRQMNDGARCRWVDGYLLEQSTQSLKDFVKQRRRWFAGMIRVVLYAEVQWWIRVPLALFTALWAISWLSMAYTMTNLFTGLRTAPMLSALGDFAFAMYAVTYLLGLFVNLRDRPPVRTARRVVLYAGQLILMPVFALMEAAGVVTGIVWPETGFHVVKK